LSRPIIARLRSESHLNERITPRGSHQRLSQQNLPIADSCTASQRTPRPLTFNFVRFYRRFRKATVNRVRPPVAPLAQRDVTGERLDRAAQLARAGNLRAIRLSEKPPFSEAFLLPG
jgi:hypothetical protein